MRRLLMWWWKCPHSEYGWPRLNKKTRRNYVVCLECGREFEYDWENMRRAA